MHSSQLFKRILAPCILSALALSGSSAFAQTFPSKQLTMIVAFPAGGASDQVGRVLGKEMGNNLNQNVLVENVVGAGGSIGVMKLVNAAADGHTIIAGSPLELILAPLGLAAAKNKAEDLRMIALAGTTSMALVVRKDLPVNTFEEFIALAQKSKDKPLSFASTGVGSLYHLIGEKFGQTSKGSVLHVPFNGLAPMMTNLIGGQVDFAFAPIAGPVPGFIENNSVKILGVTSKTQHPRFPKAALLKDTKAYEDFVFSIWAGIHAHVKTPDAVAATLHKSAYAALAVPEARKTLEASGMNLAAPMSLAELAVFYKTETDNYRAIAKAINLQAQ